MHVQQIAEQFGVAAALAVELAPARRGRAGGHYRTRLTVRRRGQRLGPDGRHFNLQIDAVWQRLAGFSLIAGNHIWGAATGPHRAAQMAARAGVHRD